MFLAACKGESSPPEKVTHYVTETVQSAPEASVASTSAATTVTSAAAPQAAAPKNKIIPVEALETLWVPSLCGNQAANLVNGKLPTSARTVSNQAGLKRDQNGTPLGGYTDINGDGRDEAVIAYVCDGGGAVGWPDNLLIYDNDLNFVTTFTGWKAASGYDPARGHIQSFRWDKDSIQIEWRGMTPTDPACCASRSLVGDLTMPGNTPVMTILSDTSAKR